MLNAAKETTDVETAPRLGLASLVFGVIGLFGVIVAALMAIGFGASARDAYAVEPDRYRFDLGRYGYRLGVVGAVLFALGVALFLLRSVAA